MQLIPAIDIRNGACVRLLRGDFDQETRYEVDPAALAARYLELGARWLHVVDLDGAAHGRPANRTAVESIAAHADLKIQLGGGIRSEAALCSALELADRAVIGSLAVTETQVVKSWLATHGADRIVLALDVRLGPEDLPQVTTHGWREASRKTLWQVLDEYHDAPLKHVLCTDIDRDGALGGANTQLYELCVRRYPHIEWQASGGVSCARDLADLVPTGVAAAVAGKSLLEGRLTDQEIRSFLARE